MYNQWTPPGTCIEAFHLVNGKNNLHQSDHFPGIGSTHYLSINELIKIAIMKNFVKMTLATLTGLFLFAVVAFFMMFAMIGAFAALGESEPVMPAKAMLKIDMAEITLAEQTAETDPFASLSGTSTAAPLGIYSAVSAIRAAAADPAVAFIYLKPDATMGGFAHIEEFRKALEDFRSSGKAIVSYMENPSNAGYYLASVSDKIYMTRHEGGMNMFTGVSSQLIFLKDVLDRLGINMQLIRHGKYKSAGEMYIRNSSSKENMEQNQAMINSIWNSWAEEIAASRGIKVSELNSMLNNLELVFPTDFQSKGLVDELLTRDELERQLCDIYVAEKPEDVESISLSDYAKLSNKVNYMASSKVAVIYADGEIIDGKEKSMVAGDRFANIIANVRKDTTVKAVVLRVNSPGGSVLASEKIKAELDLLREQVPVVASYGDYAASGGYWISANCDKIFSNATTLTGSIGVFSLIPDLSAMMKDKLHVNVTPVNSNRHADMYNCLRPLDYRETMYLQATVESVYNTFTGIVAEGRDMTVAQVDAIGQGRVWTGAEAAGIGLVDEIGTLDDAIRWAALSVEGVNGVEDVQIVEYPKPLSSLEILLESFGMNEASVFAGTPLESVENAFRSQEECSGKVYARMPYEIVLQ